MTNPTMTEICNAASRAASAAYAAQKFQVSMRFSEALAAAKDAIEAEAKEYEATLALYSCFATEEEEAEALEAERVAASASAWVRMAAWAAWEAAQAAYAAEEEEEVRAYEARCAAHAARVAKEEEEQEEEGWGDIAIEAMLRGLSAGDRDWICGEESPEDIAREWYSQGFNALGVREWAFRARCFRPESARALANQGMSAEDCRVDAPQGDTVGYAVSNGDLDALAAAALVLQA